MIPSSRVIVSAANFHQLDCTVQIVLRFVKPHEVRGLLLVRAAARFLKSKVLELPNRRSLAPRNPPIAQESGFSEQ